MRKIILPAGVALLAALSLGACKKKTDTTLAPASSEAVANVHGAGGKIAECARQPEPRLGRPVNDDLMREIDDPRWNPIWQASGE